MQNFLQINKKKNSNKSIVRHPTDASNSNIIECARKKVCRQNTAYKFDRHTRTYYKVGVKNAGQYKSRENNC